MRHEVVGELVVYLVEHAPVLLDLDEIRPNVLVMGLDHVETELLGHHRREVLRPPAHEHREQRHVEMLHLDHRRLREQLAQLLGARVNPLPSRASHPTMRPPRNRI
jgi:hypothetical protein